MNEINSENHQSEDALTFKMLVREKMKRYLFPFIILSVLTTDYILWKKGFSSPEWIEYTYGGVALFLIALEFLVPRNSQWNYINKKGILWREIASEVSFYFLSGLFALATIYPFSEWAGDHIKAYLGLSNTLPIPLFFQAIIILTTVDLIRYWVHRSMHTNAFLWRFHSLHHLPERLGAMTSVRANPFDDFLIYVPELIVFSTFGFDPSLVAVLYSVIWVISLVKHANIEIEVNWISRHFQIPQYHLHHHANHNGQLPTYNFSEVFTFWDRIFKTFDGSKIESNHQVGVFSEAKRSIIREYLGWIYLKINKI